MLYGGLEDDYLIGGPGSDYMNGQGGNDTLEDKSGDADEFTVFVDVDGGDKWFRGNNKGMAFFILDAYDAHCTKCPETIIDKVLKHDEFLFDDVGYEPLYLNAGDDLWPALEQEGEELLNVSMWQESDGVV